MTSPSKLDGPLILCKLASTGEGAGFAGAGAGADAAWGDGVFARVSALGRARKVGGVKEPPRLFILCQNRFFILFSLPAFDPASLPFSPPFSPPAAPSPA